MLIHGETDTYATRKKSKNSMYGKTALDLIHSETEAHGVRKVTELSNQLDYLEQTFKEFAKVQDDLIEEYDATLKTHSDTIKQHLEHIMDMDAVLATHAGKINSHTDSLEEHLETIRDHHERITINEGNIDALCSDVEDLQRKIYQIYQFLNSVAPDFFYKISEECTRTEHKGSDFCGNCVHAPMLNQTKHGDVNSLVKS